MRLGLLSDIHEAVERLEAAIRELRGLGVDQFVTLGDIAGDGERLDETVAVLQPLGAHAVWGNHDFGMCRDLPEALRTRFPPAVLEYFRHLAPRVDLAGCRFQHIDPHLDPTNFGELWHLPMTRERLDGFAEHDHARVFVGHRHEWNVMTPEGELPWAGEGPFQYRSAVRYVTTVHAVLEGWCALLDTDRDRLEPVRIG